MTQVYMAMAAFDQAAHDHQYSPSRWAQREDVIATHCRILATRMLRVALCVSVCVWLLLTTAESQAVRDGFGTTVEQYGSGSHERVEIAQPKASTTACMRV